MIMKTTTLFAAALACLSAMTVQAHIGMKTPCARYHPAAGCPAPPSGQSIDYNINSPIGTHGSQNFPLCKHTVPYTKRTVYNAGQTINTAYSVGAPHGGGHCQWALSYDEGKTWVVIKTLIRDCLRNAGPDYTVPVQIPANAPSGKVTFMWLWNNAVGNRELYSNCADIEIKGTNGGSITGVAPLIANYGSSSVYIPEFSNGPDGREHFDKRKPVTIRVSGGNGPAPEPVTTQSTQPPKPTATPPYPPTTTTARPIPTDCPVAAAAETVYRTVYKTITITEAAQPTNA